MGVNVDEYENMMDKEEAKRIIEKEIMEDEAEEEEEEEEHERTLIIPTPS